MIPAMQHDYNRSHGGVIRIVGYDVGQTTGLYEL